MLPVVVAFPLAIWRWVILVRADGGVSLLSTTYHKTKAKTKTHKPKAKTKTGNKNTQQKAFEDVEYLPEPGTNYYTTNYTFTARNAELVAFVWICGTRDGGCRAPIDCWTCSRLRSAEVRYLSKLMLQMCCRSGEDTLQCMDAKGGRTAVYLFFSRSTSNTNIVLLAPHVIAPGGVADLYIAAPTCRIYVLLTFSWIVSFCQDMLAHVVETCEHAIFARMKASKSSSLTASTFGIRYVQQRPQCLKA